MTAADDSMTASRSSSATDVISQRLPMIAVNAWSVSAEDVAQAVSGNVEVGLEENDAVARQALLGSNKLAAAAPLPRWRRFLAHFNELVIWILIVAAILSGMLGEWVDSLAIIAIVALNAILGFVQEKRAEQSLAALQRLAAPMARVLRSGVLRSVPAETLVPGDLVQLEAGDHMPADLRLLREFALQIQEAAMTGESVPIS